MRYGFFLPGRASRCRIFLTSIGSILTPGGDANRHFQYTDNRMSQNCFAYLPSARGLYQLPLDRFIPPLPRSIVQSWLNRNISPGGLILDPLGSNPFTAIEAAQSGHRIMFARNNPILWMLMEVIASAPSQSEMRSAVNKLLIIRRGNQSLEDHLKSIYATPCSSCGQMIQPIGFIWEKGSQLPSSRIYTCSYCGDEGERDISEYDINNLNQLGRLGLHRTRAFQRVFIGGTYEQKSIETALDCYLPRAIYTVMLLINSLDGLLIEKKEKRLIQAALLLIFDDANSLWHWPEQHHRHLILNMPSRFLEKNLWTSLECCPERLSIIEKQIAISYWPKLPPADGGICLYQRKLVDQQPLFVQEKPAALISLIPRPNQAFWTFSALWSGWLWGRKSVLPMRGALSRRRYDWYWFAQAIFAALNKISAGLDPGTPLFTLLPHSSSNNYFGLLAGAAGAGFHLNGAAYREQEESIQCEFIKSIEELHSSDSPMQQLVNKFLSSLGEPASFTKILVNCLSQLSIENGIPSDLGKMDEGLFRQMQESITTLLHDENFTHSYPASFTGGSRWWLIDNRNVSQPLTERIEERIHEKLAVEEYCTLEEMDRWICEQFCGDQTPEHALVRICIEAYSLLSPNQKVGFRFRKEEDQHARLEDIKELTDILCRCGPLFDLKTQIEPHQILWIEKGGRIIFRYCFSLCSPKIELLQNIVHPEEIIQVVLFPASKSRLIDYRIHHDPRFASSIEGNWHLLKFRHIRWMAKRENLSLEIWKEMLDGDPPMWDPPQQIQML